MTKRLIFGPMSFKLTFNPNLSAHEARDIPGLPAGKGWYWVMGPFFPVGHFWVFGLFLAVGLILGLFFMVSNLNHFPRGSRGLVV